MGSGSVTAVIGSLMRIVLCVVMHRPVSVCLPAVAPRLVKLVTKLLDCLLFGIRECQGLAQVIDVIKGTKLGYSCGQHHHKQGDQQMSLATEDGECLLTDELEPAGQKRNDFVWLKS